MYVYMCVLYVRCRLNTDTRRYKFVHVSLYLHHVSHLSTSSRHKFASNTNNDNNNNNDDNNITHPNIKSAAKTSSTTTTRMMQFARKIYKI